MTPEWNALNTECSFIEDLLGTGATQIRRANYSRRGLYFQAFTNLSLGFERVAKVVLVVDYAMQNSGAKPTETAMRAFGHDLKRLYEKCKTVATQHHLDFEHLANLDSTLHQNILQCLGEFACGDRYHNIDLLVGSARGENPIALWHQRVDSLIWRDHVSASAKAKVAANAEMMQHLIGDITMVRHIGDDHDPIESIQKASSETGFFKAVAPLRQLLVLQMIRYWHELFRELMYKNLQTVRLEIPLLSDYLAAYFNDDKYLKRRKRWDNLYPWQW